MYSGQATFFIFNLPFTLTDQITNIFSKIVRNVQKPMEMSSLHPLNALYMGGGEGCWPCMYLGNAL